VDWNAHGTGETRLILLTDWPKFHPWPNISSLRHLVLHAQHNGFDQVMSRVGDRIVLDERAFFQWALKQKQPLEPSLPLPTKRSRARQSRSSR